MKSLKRGKNLITFMMLVFLAGIIMLIVKDGGVVLYKQFRFTRSWLCL